MSIIIPYKKMFDDKELNELSFFIKPNGDMMSRLSNHEAIAHDYCAGPDYDYFCDVKQGFPALCSKEREEEYEIFRESYNYTGDFKDIDVYSSSKLSKDMLELYKKWICVYDSHCIHSDFLVFMLSFDKIETKRRKSITTSNENPHIRFYNYYLMDWDIYHFPKMKYNADKNKFEFDKVKSDYIRNSEDRAAESEIADIKSKVLVKDRHLFFK